MSTEASELGDFVRFVQSKLQNGGSPPSLDEALREFREHQAEWRPRTPLGHQLKALREQFVDGGGKLLSADEVDDALKDRRGAHFTEE